MSKLQSLDIVIIRSIKGFYRSQIIRGIFFNSENDLHFTVDIKTACKLLDNAWYSAQQKNIG